MVSGLATTLMLNVSTKVPPCNVPKPLKVNVGKPAPSSYVWVAPKAQVLVKFSPVNVPEPARSPMLLKPPLRSAAVASVPP